MHFFRPRYCPFPELTDPELQRRYVDENIVQVSDDLYAAAAMSDRHLFYKCVDEGEFLVALIRLADDEHNPVCLSFEQGDDEMLRQWRGAGVNIHGWFSPRGMTLLHFAAQRGMSEDARDSEDYLFSTGGAKILLARDVAGQTPLHTLISTMADKHYGTSGGAAEPMQMHWRMFERWVDCLNDEGLLKDRLPDLDVNGSSWKAMFGNLAQIYWAGQKVVDIYAPFEAYNLSPEPLLNFICKQASFITPAMEKLCELGIAPAKDFWEVHSNLGMRPNPAAVKWVAERFPHTRPEQDGALIGSLLHEVKKHGAQELADLVLYDKHYPGLLPRSWEMRCTLLSMMLKNDVKQRPYFEHAWKSTDGCVQPGCLELAHLSYKEVVEKISKASSEQRKMWLTQNELDLAVKPVAAAPKKRM